MQERRKGKVLPYIKPGARLFQGMPPVVLGAIVALFVLLQLFLIGISVWHLYRYILAPRMGWVDPRSRFFELIRISASPYRPPKDRDQAISELRSSIPTLRRILSPQDIAEGGKRLRLSLEQYETPLSYRYELLKLVDLLESGEEKLPPETSPSIPPSASQDLTQASIHLPSSTENSYQLSHLKELSELKGEEFFRSQAERVRLLMEIRLRSPCDSQLRPIIETLEKRPDLRPYERGVVLSTREALRRCP